MKSYQEIQNYKKSYYLVHRKKLCQYSKNYYKYSKCYGNLSDNEISQSLKDFINKYKSNYKKNEKGKIKIKKEQINISFN